MKIAIVTTHPIQYNAPWFKLLAQQKNTDVRVFYTWEQSQSNEKYDPGFGKVITWDVPLLEGYDYTFVRNISPNPGSHHFKGIDNPSLNKEIKEWKADALIVIGWAYKSHLACLRHFNKRIPILFRGDSTLLDETPGVKKILRRLFLRYVYSYIDYALYTGTNNKSYFKVHGINDAHLVYAPHAIDNERFKEPNDEYYKKANEWKLSLGINENDFTLLFAGKLEPKKDPAYILQLAKAMPSPNLKFIIAGNGELEAELKQNAVGDKRIIFIGFQNQQLMPVLYRLCDLFILPSKGPGETWGLALNEAMVCGKPVISTCMAGGAVDLIENEVNGIIIKPGEINKTVKFIEQLVTNKDFKEKAGKRSETIIEQFSFHEIVSKIHKLLNSL